MTKFLKNCIYILSQLIIIIFGINTLQTYFNSEPEHYKKQFNAVNYYKNSFDGIILGTSHATHSIRPSYLDESGIRFYNFALNGASPEYYFYWYNDIYLNSRSKPKICLFAIDFFMFDCNWLWRKFEQDAEYFTFNQFTEALLFKKYTNKMDLIVNRFPFLKYRTQITSSIKLQKGAPHFDISDYDRGYVSFSTPYDSNKFIPPSEDCLSEDKQIEYFRRLIHQLVSDSVRIIFVMTPEYGINPIIYSDMKSMKLVNQIAKQYAIPFLNFNTDLRSNINSEIRYFSDWGHMSKLGSIEFSKVLSDEIKSLTGKW